MTRRLEIREEPAEPGEETVYDRSGIGHQPLTRPPSARRSAPRPAAWTIRDAEAEDSLNPARMAGATWDGTVLPCVRPVKH